MAEQLSLQEFAQKIRERRPDLASVPDVTLVAKTLAAAPELKQYVDIGNLPGMDAVAKAVPDARTAGMVASDQAANVLRGIPQAVTSIPAVVKALTTALLQNNPYERDRQLGELVVGGLQPVGTAAKGAVSGRTIVLPGLTGNVQFPEFPEGDPSNPAWGQAAQGAGAALAATELPNVVGGGMAAIKGALPSTARAGVMFDKVMNAARNEPINTAAADAIATRAMEMKQRGSSLPKVLNDYLKDRTAPNSGLMTYEKGFDFSSNASDVSARDVTRTNAKMQRQVSQFAKALKEANRDAAAKVGMGDLYDQAMREYRQAKTMQDAAGVIRKYAVRGALTMGGGAAMYSLINELKK